MGSIKIPARPKIENKELQKFVDDVLSTIRQIAEALKKLGV